METGLSGVGQQEKKKRDVTRSVTDRVCLEFFHALQAKHPILPCPPPPAPFI